MQKPAEPDDVEGWAAMLRDDWDERARSDVRDFFVASGPHWRDFAHMDGEARLAVDWLVFDLDRAQMADWSVLEIGCGTGRLTPHARAIANDYTGIDISSAMIDEARVRCGDLAGVRFFESDGLQLPAAACDREYDLIFSIAVMIHCPRSVIGSLLESAWRHVAPGGQLRFQVFADPADTADLAPPPEAVEEATATAQVLEDAAPPEALEMIERTHYIGHVFGREELCAFVAEVTGAEARLLRSHPAHWWVAVTKP